MKKSLSVVLLVWSAACGPLPDPNLPDPRPASSYQLTIVVCEEGPGAVCTDLKKISNAIVVVDDRHCGRTNEHGSLTATVRRGPHTLHIAAAGFAGVGIRVDVPQDAHRDVELTPTQPPGA